MTLIPTIISTIPALLTLIPVIFLVIPTMPRPALYFGPTVSYRRDNWWAALSVLPQLWGRDWDHSGDGHDNLDLAHNERVHIRFLFGIDF